VNFDLIVLLFGLLLLAILVGLFAYFVIKSPPASKPWWAPDARACVAAAVIFMAAVVLFYRMTHASMVDDKVLDMMLTILFGTAFVAIINFLFGSSRSSADKDDTLNKVALMPSAPVPASSADPVPPTLAPAPPAAS
jgi:hypothetical protein